MLTTELRREIDFGTPLRTSTEEVTLTIDGFKVTVAKGTSLMRAAVEAGINIPKLCATDSLEPWGSCRLCLVEIEGRKGFPASCTTPAENGMSVKTQTPRLQELRKGVMELYISDHPLDCLTCSANGDCELQDMAGVTGLRNVRYGVGEAAGAHHLDDVKDESNPYFTYDPSKCIVCNRCVRACEETQGTFALTISGRGFDSRVSAGQNQPFMESRVRQLRRLRAGVSDRDAAGEERDLARPARAQLHHDLRVLRRRLLVQGRDEGQRGRPHDAVEGRQGERRPQLRQGPLRLGLRDASGPHHEADDPRQDHRPVARGQLGRGDQPRRERVPPSAGQVRQGLDRRHHVDRAARTRRPTSCRSWSAPRSATTTSTPARASAIRRPATASARPTARRPARRPSRSVEKADVIMVIGANPTDAHPVFASRMKKRLREGAKLIVVDPRQIELVSSPHVKADYHLPLRPGTNVAVITAMAHVVVTEGLLAEDYIAERCDTKSFRDWVSFVSRPENSPEAFEARHRRARGRPARGGTAVRGRPELGDLLRPRRDRAFAGFDDGDRHREPRDGDRQRRSRRRRRQPAARPEQRAGFVRHGLVPARAARLSPHLRHHGPHAVRDRVGRRARRRAGAAHPEHVRRGAREGASSGCTARARTSCSPTRTRSMSPTR